MRNLNAPLFDRQVYEATVSESLPLGNSIIQLTANDNDVFVSICKNYETKRPVCFLTTINKCLSCATDHNSLCWKVGGH